jgi:L-serine dehydratase
MAISALDLFRVGIGPSSSRTVGPMLAARGFAELLAEEGLLASTARVTAELHGSLAATGKAHGTDTAVLLGWAGHEPHTVDVNAIPRYRASIRDGATVSLLGRRAVAFDENRDLRFNSWEALPLHPNGMCFSAFDRGGRELLTKIYYSLRAGVVVSDEGGHEKVGLLSTPRTPYAAAILPYAFSTGGELLELCEDLGEPIAEIIRCNERQCRNDADIDSGLRNIWQVMQDCVKRGCATEGDLPGCSPLKRRAPGMYRELAANAVSAPDSPFELGWVNLYALAVSEENAAGGRVVSAPSNGAAGIIPAVLHYYRRFIPNADDWGVIDFLLTAAAIGVVHQPSTSLFDAEVGCQGEVGVACSMAAGALCAVMGGSPRQALNAAKIALVHHLGLACDPVGGLAQIPCIGRNGIAAVKAVDAAQIALRSGAAHEGALDQVIKAMHDMGAHMKSQYKGSLPAGVAVNRVEC